jgi:hypothetical protein
MAFPEFSSICLEARQLLVELLNEAMQTSLDADILDNVHPASHLIDGALDFDHPVFWDAAAEACEVLLDRVEMFMQSVREKNIDGFTDDKITSAIKRAGKAARAKAKGGWNVLMQSLVDMEVRINWAEYSFFVQLCLRTHSSVLALYTCRNPKLYMNFKTLLITLAQSLLSRHCTHCNLLRTLQ